MGEAPSTHAPVVHGTSQHVDESGLRVLIVGAGIGGCTAAIALRQQGHHVELFEQSRFATETGAAIHLAPNANGILKRLGIDATKGGANLMERLTAYRSDGKVLHSADLRAANSIWQHDWLLAHRVQLHDQLKEIAIDPHGKGPPAKLHLRSQVTDVDQESATLILKDGSSIKGDVVIGADGVHSITRAKVPGGSVKPFGSGKSAFRFMITRKSAEEDPRTKQFTEKTGEFCIWYGKDRRVAMYPTSNNQLLNFVCIHPEGESDATGDWNSQANKKNLLHVYEGWGDSLRALLDKADPESLKVWKLLDMSVLASWTEGSLALLGDAAHPFLPHQGQGGAAAIEDAVALGVALEKGTTRNEVPARLKLYEEIRYERAHRIQEYSRLAGADVLDAAKFNISEYTNYNFGHDEFDNSLQKLREWKWRQKEKFYWRMPLTFGPMPGPRQNHIGDERNGSKSTFTTASIKFKTSRTILQNLFPPGIKSYRFKSPGTVAYASISATSFDKMEWLGGSGYTWIAWYLHGIEYEKKDGSIVSGSHIPIIFENLADPIISGREELGMPKVYSDIEASRDSGSYRIDTSFRGAKWGTFSWEGLHEVSVPTALDPATDCGVVIQRYMPKVGRETKGEADANYPVWLPYNEGLQPKVQKVWKATSASIKLDAKGWDVLPTLHHIIQRLEEIPIYGEVEATIVEGLGVPDLAVAKRFD